MKRTILILLFFISSIGIFAKWTSWVDKDPFSDSERIFLSLTDVNSGVDLIIRYQQNVLELFVKWHQFITTNDSIEVLYRIDKDDAITNPWSISTDYKSTFFQGNVLQIFKRLVDSKIFAVRVTPWGENPVITIFETIGLKKALTKYPSLVKLLEPKAEPNVIKIFDADKKAIFILQDDDNKLEICIDFNRPIAGQQWMDLPCLFKLNTSEVTEKILWQKSDTNKSISFFGDNTQFLHRLLLLDNFAVEGIDLMDEDLSIKVSFSMKDLKALIEKNSLFEKFLK